MEHKAKKTKLSIFKSNLTESSFVMDSIIEVAQVLIYIYIYIHVIKYKQIYVVTLQKLPLKTNTLSLMVQPMTNQQIVF